MKTKKEEKPIKFEKENRWMVLFIVAIISCAGAGSYIFYNDYSQQNDWTTHNITGRIVGMQLYNQFPTIELYIAMSNGNYTLVNVNPFWTHAQLVNYDQSKIIKITYKENSAGAVKVTFIETVED